MELGRKFLSFARFFTSSRVFFKRKWFCLSILKLKLVMPPRRTWVKHSGNMKKDCQYHESYARSEEHGLSNVVSTTLSAARWMVPPAKNADPTPGGPNIRNDSDPCTHHFDDWYMFVQRLGDESSQRSGCCWLQRTNCKRAKTHSDRHLTRNAHPVARHFCVDV